MLCNKYLTGPAQVVSCDTAKLVLSKPWVQLN